MLIYCPILTLMDSVMLVAGFMQTKHLCVLIYTCTKGEVGAMKLCDVLLCFYHFQMWCLGSGVVLVCIDS